MIDYIFKYQASIFIDGNDMVYSPSLISTLLSLFSDMKMAPSTFREITTPNPKPELRVKLFSSDDKGWEIIFGSRRIDILRKPFMPNDKDAIDLSTFCNEVPDLFNRVIEKLDKKAKRLSLITSVLLKEMTNAELNNTYLKLFKPFSVYKDNPAYEWIWKSVIKKSEELIDLNEELNLITVIKRIGGQLELNNTVMPIDRIQLSFDLNTSQSKMENRFSDNHIKEFYKKAKSMHDDLTKDVKDVIYG